MEKILFYGWGALGENYTIKALQECGYEVSVYKKKMKNYDMDGQVSVELMLLIHQDKPDYLFSIDYFPLLASVAQTCVLPYLSWVYDSPHHTLFSETTGYRGNYIFIFDKRQWERLRRRGLERVFYLPLGTDVDSMQNVITAATPKEREKYRSEVSFVGRLYADEYNDYNKLEHAEEGAKLEFQTLIEQQKFCYEDSILYQSMEEQPGLAGEVVRTACLELGPGYERCPQEMAAALLGREVTAQERKELVSEAAGRFPFVLYSDSDTTLLPGVQNRGYIDYETQMPLAFHESNINLNITLRTIESGIPLRALDIMGSGGFLLSNYQPELAEWFLDGEELVLFQNKEDCLSKIAYYLTHEEERAEIARRGCLKVKQLFLLEQQCGKIMETAGNLEERIAFFLETSGEEAWEKLGLLCRSEVFLELARRNNCYAQFKVLCDIALLETKEGIRETVFSNFRSLKEADSYFTALKFLIHRIEFQLPQEYQDELMDFLSNTHTSRFALMFTANQTVMANKKGIGTKLADYAAMLGRQEDVLPLFLWGMQEEGQTFLREWQEKLG